MFYEVKVTQACARVGRASPSHLSRQDRRGISGAHCTDILEERSATASLGNTYRTAATQTIMRKGPEN